MLAPGRDRNCGKCPDLDDGDVIEGCVGGVRDPGVDKNSDKCPDLDAWKGWPSGVGVEWPSGGVTEWKDWYSEDGKVAARRKM